ncbi:MAG: aspartyl/asparaginyl beta-hydroxylase domain-containing protein [Lysobacteraceae bacterium]
MLQLPDHPKIDKDALIGGCTRIDVAVDLPQLLAEFHSLPAELWGGRGGRVGVHMAAEAIFLRGHAPAEGNLPIADREALDLLPCIRKLIEQLIPAPPMRCLLAKLAAGATVALHVDRPDYFSKTIRIHVPIVTDPAVLMIAQGKAYRMAAGEVWALNNSNVHGVINDWSQPRTHLICDFLPTPQLEALILAGERDLGVTMAGIDERFARATPVAG